MNCLKCGHELNAGSIACPKCGHLNVPVIKYGNYDKKSIVLEKDADSISDSATDSSETEEIYLSHKLDLVRPRNKGGNTPSKPIRSNRPGNKAEAREVAEEIVVARDMQSNVDYDRYVKKERGFLSFLKGLFILIILLGAAAFAAYYAYNKSMGGSTKEYIDSIAKIQSQISKVNSDFSITLKNSPMLPVDNIIKQIPSSIDNISQINENFSKIIAPSMYSDSHNKLGEAIKLNKLIYQQLGIILKSPIDPHIQKNAELLSQYLDQCMTDYMGIKIGNLSFSLPDETMGIPGKIAPWIKQKQSDYSQIMSLITTFSKYFEDMDKLFVTYQSSLLDLNQTLKSVKNRQATWEDLIAFIDKSNKLKTSVKTDYSKLSVPSYLKNINKLFGPILDESLNYNIKYRIAVMMDKNFNKELLTPAEVLQKTKDIELLYQDAEKVNSSFSLNYQKFATDFKTERDKYIDPEFVLKLKTGK